MTYAYWNLLNSNDFEEICEYFILLLVINQLLYLKYGFAPLKNKFIVKGYLRYMWLYFRLPILFPTIILLFEL